jgi:hypothetical protein
MARPRLETRPHRVDVVLTLRPGEDDDLIAWFERLPARERSAAVIARLRTGCDPTAPAVTADSEKEVADTLFSMMM